jgi:hypothetical protein
VVEPEARSLNHQPTRVCYSRCGRIWSCGLNSSPVTRSRIWSRYLSIASCRVIESAFCLTLGRVISAAPALSHNFEELGFLVSSRLSKGKVLSDVFPRPFIPIGTVITKVKTPGCSDCRPRSRLMGTKLRLLSISISFVETHYSCHFQVPSL